MVAQMSPATGRLHRRWAMTAAARAAVQGVKTAGATASPCRDASGAALVPYTALRVSQDDAVARCSWRTEAVGS